MKRILQLSVAALTTTLFFGCGTAARRIDTAGNEGLTSTHELNFKDWQDAAHKNINSLIESGVLSRNDGRKNIIMVSTVKNSTREHINTAILTNLIRKAILKSQQAYTTTAVSAKGMEDKSTRQVRGLKNDKMFDQKTVKKDGTVIAPDMSLAGEIIQQKTVVGRDEESYFMFHLTLTDLKTGLAVWENTVEVAKQRKRPLFGL